MQQPEITTTQQVLPDAINIPATQPRQRRNIPLIIIGSIVVIQTAKPALLLVLSFNIKYFFLPSLIFVLYPVIGFVLILIGILTKIPAEDPTAKRKNALTIIAGGLIMWFSLFIFSWTFSILFTSFSYPLFLIVLFLFGLNFSGAYLIYHSYSAPSVLSKASIPSPAKKYITPTLRAISFIAGLVLQFIVLSLTRSVINCNNNLACFGIIIVIPIIAAMLPLTYIFLYHGYKYFAKTSYVHLSLIIGICFSTLALYAVNNFYADPRFIGDFSVFKILTQSALVLLSTVGIYAIIGVVFIFLAKFRSA